MLEGAIGTRMLVRSAGVRRALPAILGTLDMLLIYFAIVVAYWIRYSLQIGPPIQQQLSFQRYVPVALMLVAIMMPVLFAKGAYRLRFGSDLIDQFSTIFSAATITVATIVVITSMLHQYEYSRGVIVYLWVLLILFLAAGRTLFRMMQSTAHRRGWWTTRTLVVGASDMGRMVMQNIVSRPDLGYHVVGFVEHRPAAHVQDFGRFRALGTLTDVPDLIRSRKVDEVIIALPASAHSDVWPVLHMCEQYGVGLKIVPDLFEMSLSRVQVDDIAGIPLLHVQERPLRRLALAGKRLLDVAIALLLLALSAPLLVLLALLIRLDSPGPVVLVQDRVGLGRRRFHCWKFRSMHDGADVLQPLFSPHSAEKARLFKLKDDPRCTRVGRWMRRWSLDELPQLVNVLRGDMSLVGPRPPLPEEVAQYEPRHLHRLDVKPGLTGLWQVSGRSDLDFDEMVEMDLFYVENWSIALDIRILMRTVSAVLARRGAY